MIKNIKPKINKISKKADIETSTIGYILLGLIILFVLLAFILTLKGGYGTWLDKIKSIFGY